MMKLACPPSLAGIVVMLASCSEAPDSLTSLRMASAELNDGSLFGRVVDETTGESVPGAEVRYRHVARTGQALREPDAVSDAEGLFELKPSYRLDSVVRIDAEGYAPFVYCPFPYCDAPSRAYEARLSPPAILEGRVLDEEGRGVSEVQVDLSWVEFDRGCGSGTSGEDGSYRITGLPSACEIRVRFRTTGRSGFPNYTYDIVCLRADRTRRLDIVLRGHASVEARLRAPDGRGVPGRVMLMAPVCSVEELDSTHAFDRGWSVIRAMTDVEGRCRFENLRPGSWWIAADDGKGFPTWSRQRVEVPPGPETRGVELMGTIVPPVMGTVVGASAEPGDSCAVMLVEASGSRWTIAWVDEDAAFRFRDVPDGDWQLFALAYTLGATPSSEPSYRRSQRFAVTIGEAFHEIHFEEGGSLECSVRDAVTGKRSGGWVRFERFGETEASPWWGSEWLSASTDQEGHCRINDLLPGTYDVTVCRGDGTVGAERIEVRANETACADLLLREGVRMKLSHRAGHGMVRAFVYADEALVTDTWLVRDESAWVVVPAGSIVVRFHHESGDRQEQVRFALPGEAHEMVFSP